MTSIKKKIKRDVVLSKGISDLLSSIDVIKQKRLSVQGVLVYMEGGVIENERLEKRIGMNVTKTNARKMIDKERRGR